MALLLHLIQVKRHLYVILSPSLLAHRVRKWVLAITHLCVIRLHLRWLKRILESCVLTLKMIGLTSYLIPLKNNSILKHFHSRSACLIRILKRIGNILSSILASGSIGLISDNLVLEDLPLIMRRPLLVLCLNLTRMQLRVIIIPVWLTYNLNLFFWRLWRLALISAENFLVFELIRATLYGSIDRIRFLSKLVAFLLYWDVLYHIGQLIYMNVVIILARVLADVLVVGLEEELSVAECVWLILLILQVADILNLEIMFLFNTNFANQFPLAFLTVLDLISRKLIGTIRLLTFDLL